MNSEPQDHGPAYTDEDKAILTTLSHEAYIAKPRNARLVGDDRYLLDLDPSRQLAELRPGRNPESFSNCLEDANKRAAWIVELAGHTEPMACDSCASFGLRCGSRGPFRDCRRARITVNGGTKWALNGSCANCYWTQRKANGDERSKVTKCSFMKHSDPTSSERDPGRQDAAQYANSVTFTTSCHFPPGLAYGAPIPLPQSYAQGEDPNSWSSNFGGPALQYTASDTNWVTPSASFQTSPGLAYEASTFPPQYYAQGGDPNSMSSNFGGPVLQYTASDVNWVTPSASFQTSPGLVYESPTFSSLGDAQGWYPNTLTSAPQRGLFSNTQPSPRLSTRAWDDTPVVNQSCSMSSFTSGAMATQGGFSPQRVPVRANLTWLSMALQVEPSSTFDSYIDPQRLGWGKQFCFMSSAEREAKRRWIREQLRDPRRRVLEPELGRQLKDLEDLDTMLGAGASPFYLQPP